MYIHTCIHTYALMYVHTYIRTYVHTYPHTHNTNPSPTQVRLTVEFIIEKAELHFVIA